MGKFIQVNAVHSECLFGQHDLLQYGIGRSRTSLSLRLHLFSYGLPKASGQKTRAKDGRTRQREIHSLTLINCSRKKQKQKKKKRELCLMRLRESKMPKYCQAQI